MSNEQTLFFTSILNRPSNMYHSSIHSEPPAVIAHRTVNRNIQAALARTQYLNNVPIVNINLVSTGSPSISPPNPLRSPIPHPQVQLILNQFRPRITTGGINDHNHFKRKRRNYHQ